jgi:DNA-binding GntR family transcriptional regulator
MLRNKFVPRYSISLVKQVTDFLTNAVIEGELKSGERLGEAALQRKFGISRGPIREAFRILEKNRLLVTTPRKGTHVRAITSKYIEEIFPIRANLEGLAARMAISNLEAKDFKRAEVILDKMAEAAKKKDLKLYIKQHYQYHQIYINATKNNTLIEMLENLRHQAIWFLFSSPYDQENYQYSVGAHRKLLDLFIKRDAEGAETLAREHIMVSYDKFLPFWRSKIKESS